GAQEILSAYRQVGGSLSADYRAMEASHSRVAELLRERHPELPNNLFRWARGRFCFYLRGRSYACGDHAQSLLYLGRACCHDPLLLTLPKSYSSLAKCARGLLVSLRWFRRAKSCFLRLKKLRRGNAVARNHSERFPRLDRNHLASRLSLFDRLNQARIERVRRACRASRSAP